MAAPGGTPSNSPVDVLAAVTIADAGVPQGRTTIVGAFAGTKITPGVDYAAVLTRHAAFGVAEFPGTATCDGDSFTADGAAGFTSLPIDLAVSVFVD